MNLVIEIFSHCLMAGLVKRGSTCHEFVMLSKNLLICFASVVAISVDLRAQTETPTEKTKESVGDARFWQANLSGGSYMVALDRIVSVSRHKYLLDGALIVDEVTIDTTGQALARFYFISPVTDAAPGNTVADLAKHGRELVDKATKYAGTEVQNMVIKKYPDTTHAKSIEYRLLTEAELSSLYGSVQNAWETGRGRKFNAK